MTKSDASAPGLPPGANASAPWSMPWAGWYNALRRVWVMKGFHELGLLSAGLAFYVFLALTPLIAATVMVYGLVGDVDTVSHQMERLTDVLPPEAATILESQLVRIVSTSSGVTGLALVIALFFSIYGGMRAASGMISALNIINDEHETRGFIALTLRETGLTLAAVLIALTGVLSGGIFAWLQTQTSVYLGGATQLLFKFLTWGLAVGLGTGGFALIMRYGPDRRPAQWRWLLPGSVLATLLWIAVSFGFSLYVAYISDYNATYGSLSAIVVFLMWLYLSAYGVLLGALLNAEIERQVHADTTAGAPRPPGERGAVLADVIEAAIPTLHDLERRKRQRADAVRRQAEKG
ncbi:YihY/virulence factor BrkB family protein [Novosphingobium mangrovi (ex Huang et al. 2023)]|uniref:YihY/virulence factor BrkB family protein n=1 Tax=Novosphingobium mangrovi (ex Huang et al. 2023) TaxID=2976432 RepID=A0ABT2I8B9_9SPHN|nr:YihY/virulence factor BrkB family protein [Novosphingobium mangrovi (ex Huang et al. 2023)]MCT2401072.1 YihY/virulence factor BrkB family protein [Novosphingobium mangrovi (ex Huang et al. 2023)]